MTFRDLPSVERLLKMEPAAHMMATFGRSLTVQALRHRLDAARSAIRQGSPAPEAVAILDESRITLEAWLKPTLRPVINATGVIIHTNLGRAPLSRMAQEAVQAVASGYSTLEYDLLAGSRGSRESHAEHLLKRLTGAEAALVVNNNASAVLLSLTALARDQEVLISRSQLIEIGGGFRIPDVLAESGARLVEVGTTNRTHLRDFESAVTERTAVILRAHHSNFKIIGFTTEPSLAELISLAREHDLTVVDDIGSGALLDTAEFGLGHEPMVQESLQGGAAVVSFSGDKLLGGPQAGILLGAAAVIDRLRMHPMTRAVRPDKLCLAALSATLQHYLRDEATDRIPVWRMIAAVPDDIKARALEWQAALRLGEVISGRSTVGGGSLPEETLPTWLLRLPDDRPDDLAARLRGASPPIIGRIENDRVVLDPRTVLEDQEKDLLEALKRAMSVQA